MDYITEKYLLYLLFLTVLSLHVCPSVRAMKCPPCDKIHCAPRSAAKLECKGGATTGVCGCCPICARVDGEKCGGYYNYLGKCDKGLYCEPLVTKHKKIRDHHKSRTPDGICKRGRWYIYLTKTTYFIKYKPHYCRIHDQLKITLVLWTFNCLKYLILNNNIILYILFYKHLGEILNFIHIMLGSKAKQGLYGL